MAKLIRFDLPINGEKVKTLDELRNNITLEILEHYETGLLEKWLRVRGYNYVLLELKKITTNDNAERLKAICGIFEIDSSIQEALAISANMDSASVESLWRLPIHECLVPRGLFATGLGTVIITRKINKEEVVVGGFLLDVFCLGVKNCFLRTLQIYEYESTIAQIHQQENFVHAKSALVRTLVEQCMEYAYNLGFKPHSDYDNTVKYIFGDIDPNECPEIFTFGLQGKPTFIPGPDDTPERCEQIVQVLKEKCGPKSFRIPSSLMKKLFPPIL